MQKKLKISREEYVDALMKAAYEIVFEKKDGTLRSMRCTLMSELIPKKQKELILELMDKPKKKIPNHIVPVYDLEKQEWRSFRVDSVIIFKKITKMAADALS